VVASALFRISADRQFFLDIAPEGDRIAHARRVAEAPAAPEIITDQRWPFLLCPSELRHPEADVQYWRIVFGKRPRALRHYHDPFLHLDILFDAPAGFDGRPVPFAAPLIQGLLWHIRRDGRAGTAAVQYDGTLWLAVADEAGTLLFVQRFDIGDSLEYYLALTRHIMPDGKGLLYAGGDLTAEAVRADHPRLQSIYAEVMPFGSDNWWAGALQGVDSALRPYGALLLCAL